MLNLLIKPVWLVIENQVQNQVGHAAYGTFMALYSFTYMFGVLTDMGMNQFTTKQLAASDTFAPEYFPVLFPLKWLFSLVFPFFILVGGWLIGYREREMYYLLLIGLGFTFTQFIAFLRSVLQGSHLFNTDAVASVGERLVLLVLVGILFWYGLTLDGYIYARTLALLLTFGAVYFTVRQKFGSFGFAFDSQKVKYLFKASLPFAVMTLVYGVNEKVDMVMLERLSSKTEAGIYAAAYRWVDAAMMYLWTVLPIFFARFAATDQNRPEQEKLLQFGQVVVSVPVIFGCVFIFYYGRLLFWQFTNSSVQEINMMQLNLVLLFANVLVHGFFALYGTLLNSGRHVSTVSWLIGASIVLNISLNAIFIPVYGSLAAATNTLLCALFVSGGYLVIIKQRLPVRVPYGLMARLILVTLLLIGLFKTGTYLPVPWYGTAILAGIIYLGLIVFLRIIRLEDVQKLLRRN